MPVAVLLHLDILLSQMACFMMHLRLSMRARLSSPSLQEHLGARRAQAAAPAPQPGCRGRSGWGTAGCQDSLRLPGVQGEALCVGSVYGITALLETSMFMRARESCRPGAQHDCRL